MTNVSFSQAIDSLQTTIIGTWNLCLVSNPTPPDTIYRFLDKLKLKINEGKYIFSDDAIYQYSAAETSPEKGFYRINSTYYNELILIPFNGEKTYILKLDKKYMVLRECSLDCFTYIYKRE